MKNIITGSIIAAMLGTLTSMMTLPNGRNDKYIEWKAPAWADTLTNPFKGNKEAVEKGGELYSQFCAVCHGEQGKGNGAAGYKIIPAPADHTSRRVQKQSDGAIYWKISEGRLPMSPYKKILDDEQRWQLVNFIRTLK